MREGRGTGLFPLEEEALEEKVPFLHLLEANQL